MEAKGSGCWNRFWAGNRIFTQAWNHETPDLDLILWCTFFCSKDSRMGASSSCFVAGCWMDVREETRKKWGGGGVWGWNYRRWNEARGDLEMWVGWWGLYIKRWPNQAVSFMGAGSYHSCNSLLTTGVDSKNGSRWDLCLNRWFVIIQTACVLTASSNGPVSKVCVSIAHLNSLPMQKILNVYSVYWMVDHLIPPPCLRPVSLMI